MDGFFGTTPQNRDPDQSNAPSNPVAGLCPGGRSADEGVMSRPRRALSIRQPWAEQILRGVKSSEFRSRPTRVVGERFYLYAARTPGPAAEFGRLGHAPGDLPTGVLVGTAVIAGCRALPDGSWAWDLTAVRRLPEPVRPDRHPQPAWFHPFATPADGGRKAA